MRAPLRPLEIAHKIMSAAALDHMREMNRARAMHSQQPELQARDARVRLNLGELTQVTAAYHDLALLIDAAQLPNTPGVAVHPSKHTKLAKDVNAFMQKLGFKDSQLSIYRIIKDSSEKTRTPVR